MGTLNYVEVALVDLEVSLESAGGQAASYAIIVISYSGFPLIKQLLLVGSLTKT